MFHVLFYLLFYLLFWLLSYLLFWLLFSAKLATQAARMRPATEGVSPRRGGCCMQGCTPS